jgi:hypothetical protein
MYLISASRRRAHRFAIQAHRQLRTKTGLASRLGRAGHRPGQRKALLMPLVDRGHPEGFGRRNLSTARDQLTAGTAAERWIRITAMAKRKSRSNRDLRNLRIQQMLFIFIGVIIILSMIISLIR